MLTPRLRPRLELAVDLPPAEITANVERRIRQPDSPCLGLVTDEQIELRMRGPERRFWSPQLVVLVRPAGADGGASRLTGHFGPDAQVWTLFLAMYAFVILSAGFGVLYGSAQLLVAEPPTAFWSVPVAVVLIVLIYTAAGIGQRLGHDQTEVLQEFLERSIRDDGNTPRSADGAAADDGELAGLA